MSATWCSAPFFFFFFSLSLPFRSHCLGFRRTQCEGQELGGGEEEEGTKRPVHGTFLWFKSMDLTWTCSMPHVVVILARNLLLPEPALDPRATFIRPAQPVVCSSCCGMQKVTLTFLSFQGDVLRQVRRGTMNRLEVAHTQRRGCEKRNHSIVVTCAKHTGGNFQNVQCSLHLC